MAKIFKRTILCVFGLLTCMLAGLFFVGCNVDYSKISLSADKETINISAGESTDINITINGYQKGFSNVVQVNVDKPAIVNVEDPVYLAKDKIKLTLTAKAGGQANITVETFEGGKSCQIVVFVDQTSENVVSSNKIMYVSDQTPFVPNHEYFDFDSNTTIKDLSFFYIEDDEQDTDFTGHKLLSVEGSKASFSGLTDQVDLFEFDQIRMEGEEVCLYYKGQNVVAENGENVVVDEGIINIYGKFQILSIYNPSVNSQEYAEILYNINDVYILPSIKMKLSGGYLQEDGSVEFADINNDNVQPIYIVPNYKSKAEYVLKMEVASKINSSFFKFEKWLDNHNVIVDFYDYEEDDTVDENVTVRYFKISQNSQVQSQTEFGLRVFYDIAQDAEDDSVNVAYSFKVITQIAPTALTVNGTTDGSSLGLSLYNYYKYPDFGWVELFVNVISGYGSSPNFKGVYFEFDAKYIDLMHNNRTVVSEDMTNLYDMEDLQESFYIRGVYGAELSSGEASTVTVHIVSDILTTEEDKNMSVSIPCKITEGATSISAEIDYGDNGTYYIDLNGGDVVFDKQIYADHRFQFFTYRFIGGTDVLNISTGAGDPCISNNAEITKYYLNILLSPKQVGVGIYRIYLDNGMTIDLTFNCIESLDEQLTEFSLANSGNEAVTYFQLIRDENFTYDNHIFIEILNRSTKDEIIFGSTADLIIDANINKDIEFVVSNLFNITNPDLLYRITTKENGIDTIDFNLSGYDVNGNFQRENKNVAYKLTVVSYSLANEFYLKNGDSYALSNVVYYGDNLRDGDEASKVTFTPVINNVGSFAFYKYDYDPEIIKLAFDEAIDFDAETEVPSYIIDRNDIFQTLVYENYDKKFIYFEAKQNNTQSKVENTFVLATISRTDDQGQTEEREIKFEMPDGLIFDLEDKSYAFEDGDGNIYIYQVEFSSVFSVGFYGEFDFADFCYTTISSQDVEYTVLLTAHIDQRDWSGNQYRIKIERQRYQSIEGISLATASTRVDFSNNKLTQTLGVYTYPVNSTNKTLKVQFIKSNDNDFADMVTFSIDYSSKNNGIYAVTLSCERFFEENKDELVNIDCDLSGKVYIFPAEWGDTVSAIDNQFKPICIDVQYRNGSRANPYLLETAEDVRNINLNETTLKSHYEINSVIDMSNTNGFTPIGILGEKLVGFSGTIVGTNSHAAITNIVISEGNFYKEVDGIGYGGLFAKINYVDNIFGEAINVVQTSIENLSITGKFDLNINTDSYIGLLSAVNSGVLTNVEANLLKSNITTQSNLYFGGLVGINYGALLQDFSRYGENSYGESLTIADEVINVYTLDEKYIYSNIYDECKGQNPKNFTYFNDFVDIYSTDATVIAGGIVGSSNGFIESIKDDSLKNYGYSGYASYSLINITGSLNNKNLYLGGAIGVMAFADDLLPSREDRFSNVASNLLVGGEVNTSTASINGSGTDQVGGLVGRVDTKVDDLHQQAINVLNNTSRTFVRGYNYVGALVGVDNYTRQTASNTNANFGNNNKVQAVDDGRNAFNSAMIIKYKDISSQDVIALEDENIKLAFYSVGNSLVNNRDYANEDSGFIVESYLDRSPIITNSSDIINTAIASTSQTFGDYLIFEKGASQLKQAYFFDHKDVQLEYDGESPFKMNTDSTSAPDLFFLYYFAVESYANGNSSINIQEDITDLNEISTNSSIYPFKIKGTDVSINAFNNNILNVDTNGNFKIKGVGLAEIKLTSILNVNKSKSIFVYITNYFDKDVSTSIFYTSASANGVNIKDESIVNVYGNSSTSLNVVPSYILNELVDVKGNVASISANGILRYKNVDYQLTKNTQITTEASPEDRSFSAVQIDKQTIIFYKNKNVNNLEGGEIDSYQLKPVLKFEIKQGDTIYYYHYYLDKAQTNIDVRYLQTATAIDLDSGSFGMRTNEHYSGTIEIKSQNDEQLFYKIFKDGEVIQSRIPNNVSEVAGINEDYFAITNDDLFDFTFERREGKNIFDYEFRVNLDSVAFANRLIEDIYGLYRIELFANELEEGVSNYFIVNLQEALVNNIDITNYSNINDSSVGDNLIVPGQRGLLQIVIDPLEALLDEISISNSAVNYEEGRNIATFSFIYEKITEKGVQYVADESFGSYLNGTFTFGYQNMLEYFADLNKKWQDAGENSSVSYTGKIYIAYVMGTDNVANDASMGFDVKVTDVRGNVFSAHKDLVTKLSSYARLVFDDKTNYNGYYYLARGLSYNLTLQTYGFSEEQITITSSNSAIANIVSNGNGKYTLNITQNTINYEGEGNELGYYITINVDGNKIVDGVPMPPTRETLHIYVMEYVLDYSYQGQFEDIVNGMENGVISVAIGNPYPLEIALRQYIEYDSSNDNINQEVNSFLQDLTNNITWKVHYDGIEEVLQEGKIINEDYFKINSLTVTPMKLYNPESDIYHFSVDGNYRISRGEYIFADQGLSADTYRLYTEFSFDVHEQSTQDSPLPVESYNELLNMADGEWYILLNDITLPSDFVPITTNIAGLDGNGWNIRFSGQYNFGDATEIGLFANIGENTTLKNITVQLNSDVIFTTSASAFNMGLLSATNDGIITNCMTDSNSYKLSIICPNATNTSYVAGFVAINTGHITNSRSKMQIIANVNLSGFVGENSGHIASSYFLNGSLKNQIINNYTAGFVINNSGDIYTSYVSGLPDANSVYYNSFDNEDLESGNAILSSSSIAGFAFINSGNIKDCYSNIRLQSGEYASGFVFENGGTIERCFSTSVLDSQQDSNFGFANSNSHSSTLGIIKDCYFLKDTNVNDSIGEISNNSRTDISPLTIADFANIDKYFADYVVTNGRNIDSVWFFNDNPTNKNGFGGATFNTGRLELVAPNIIARSQRIFDYAEDVTDPDSGATYVKYHYIYVTGSPALGTQFNPITISSAEEMENYILQENNSANYNYGHYRLINDIDYQDYFYNSNLYTTKFRGYFEGNFMYVANISLLSSDAMTSAGLFSEVEKTLLATDSVGAVMNFTLRPRTVSFSNTSVVGGLTGKLIGGTVVNIDIDLPSTDSMLVVGHNIVGGAVGLTSGNFKMQNVSSKYGAKARYQLSSLEAGNNVYDEIKNDYSQNSYAGSIVGVVGGNGQIYNSVIDSQLSVLADKVGLAFGLIDSQASADKVSIVVNQNMLINAYSYGGFVAGEVRGSLTDVNVSGQMPISFTNFKQIPFIADAIGGVVGLLNGGNLTDVSMTQDIQVSSVNSISGIEVLGGIAGEVTAPSQMRNINVEADLIGFNFIGAIAGTTSSTLSLTDIVVQNTELAVLGNQIQVIGIGGIVGRMTNEGSLVLQSSKAEELNELTKDIENLKEVLAIKASEKSTFNEELEGIKENYSDEKEHENKFIDEWIKTGYVDVNSEIESLQTELNYYEMLLESSPDDPILIAQINIYKDAIENLNKINAEILPLYNKMNDRINSVISTETYNVVASYTSNIIDISVYANVNLYKTDLNSSVGTLAGRIENNLQNNISDTICFITGTISTLDLAVSGDSFPIHFTVEDADGLVGVSKTENGSYHVSAGYRMLVAQRTFFNCDVTFIGIDADESKNYTMILNLFGNPVLKE